MTRDEFERAIDQVIEEFYENHPDLAAKIDNLVIVVEEHPTREQDPHGTGLLGIYEGVSLLERSGDYWGALPDQITVFRQSHLELGLSREELLSEIRRTVLHELAHHLGISDERLTELGWD